MRAERVRKKIYYRQRKKVPAKEEGTCTRKSGGKKNKKNKQKKTENGRQWQPKIRRRRVTRSTFLFPSSSFQSPFQFDELTIRSSLNRFLAYWNTQFNGLKSLPEIVKKSTKNRKESEIF